MGEVLAKPPVERLCILMYRKVKEPERLCFSVAAEL